MKGVVFNIREWSDLELWIAEVLPNYSTVTVDPREYVAPIRFDGEKTHYYLEGKGILYFPKDFYERDM